jgi:hypothetical protein
MGYKGELVMVLFPDGVLFSFLTFIPSAKSAQSAARKCAIIVPWRSALCYGRRQTHVV